jgi:hypothetical protein
MKRHIPVSTIFALFALCLSSCYRDIDMESYRPEPALVLQAVASSDTVVTASIGRTKFFTDTGRYEMVADADVELYVNGVFREKMWWTENKDFYGGGVYRSSVKSKSGDRIKIKAITKYGEVWAEETVPAKVEIKSVNVSYREIYDQKGFGVDDEGHFVEVPDIEITYRITFEDDPAIANFYLIRIEDDVHGIMGNPDYSSDPVFVEQVNVISGLFGGKTINGQGGRSFSDKMINGKRYTLVVVESQSKSIYDSGLIFGALNRKITLYAIPESYYHYMTSMQTAADASDMASLSTLGFAEPVRIYSNVHGGVGILATSQTDTIRIDLKNILTE